MYKLNLDPKYYFINISNIGKNTVNLHISEKFKNYTQDVFYEISYVIKQQINFDIYHSRIPSTITSTIISENINTNVNIDHIEIDSIYYCNVDDIYTMKKLYKFNIHTTQELYKVYICTYDKKIYSKLKLIL